MSLINEKIGCNTQCRTMQLGSLVQAMHTLGFLDGDIHPGQYGHSLSTLHRQLRQIQTPKWCEPFTHPNDKRNAHRCSYGGNSSGDVLAEYTSSLFSLGQVRGLKLDEFAARD